MSMTRDMSRTSRVVEARLAVLVAALLTVGAVAGGAPGAAAAGPPARPSAGAGAPPGATDPPARVAALRSAVQRAADALATASHARDRTVAELQVARREQDAARRHTDDLALAAAAAAARAEASRARLGELAAAAYRDGPSPGPLASLLSSRSAGDFEYRKELVRHVGDAQRRIAAQAHRDELEAQRAETAAREERDRLRRVVTSLEQELPARDHDVEQTRASTVKEQFWLARWQSLLGGVATPILGPTLLDAREMTDWFTASGRHARTTVPIGELAQDFVVEASAVGVRGDIAFAQSILETGGFYFPDGGQVAPADNNFAGIGACDSCPHGRTYPDARTGVRAQVQLLRVYADPHLTNAQLDPPPVDALLDTHFLKGKVTTWGGLTHTWATADAYGDRILSIYEGMLGWLTDRARA